MEALNRDTVKNSLMTKLKELQELQVKLELEKRILEKQVQSKFPQTRDAAAKALIGKSQEFEANEIAIGEVERMIKEK